MAEPSYASDPIFDPNTLLAPAPTGLRSMGGAPTGGIPAGSLRPTAPRNVEHVMSMAEKVAAGIPADKRHLPYRMDADGNVSLPPEVTPEKGEGEDSVAKQRDAAAAVLTATGVDLERGVDPVIPIIEASTSGGLEKWAAEKYGDITGEATSGMEAIGRLETIANDLTLQMTGGSLGAQISNTDRDFITKRMGDIGNPATPANKRLAAWDQVKKRLAQVTGVQMADTWTTETPPPAEGEAAPGAPGAAPPTGEPATEPGAPPDLALSFDEQGNVVHNIESTGRAVASDTGLIGEKGGTHTERDPRLRGTNATVKAMIKRHESPESMATYLQGKGMKPDAIAYVLSMERDIRQWEDENDTKWNGTVDLENIDVPNTALENVVGSDVGAGAAGYADALSAFSLDNAAAILGKDPEEIRTALDASRVAHPKSTTLGNIAGAVTAATGATAAASKAGLGPVPAILAGDIGYGGAAGAGATDIDPETGEAATFIDRAKGAAKGAAYAGIASGAGTAVGAGMKALGSPSPDKVARALNEEGIPTTIGAQYGGRTKRFEDWVSGQPGGGIVSDRQMDAIKRVNERTFDRVLKPLGVANKAGAVGEEAVEFAQKKISAQYSKALDGKTVQTDPKFATDFARSFTKVADLPTVGEEVAKRIEGIVTPHLQGGRLTGEGMQRVSQQLREMKSGYRGTPMGHDIGRAVDDVEESIFGMFRRQAKEVVPEYNKAQVAYKRLAIASDAVLAAENAPIPGVFMPSQLRAADKAAAKASGGKIAAAGNVGKGERQFGKLSKAAQERLPKKAPDSGTARLVIPAMLLGAGSGGAAVGAAGAEEGDRTEAGMSAGAKALTLAAILTGAYTKGGQRLLTKPGRGITSPRAARTVKKIGEKGQAPAAHVLTGAEVAAAENKKRRLQREKEKARGR